MRFVHILSPSLSISPSVNLPRKNSDNAMKILYNHHLPKVTPDPAQKYVWRGAGKTRFWHDKNQVLARQKPGFYKPKIGFWFDESLGVKKDVDNVGSGKVGLGVGEVSLLPRLSTSIRGN